MAYSDTEARRRPARRDQEGGIRQSSQLLVLAGTAWGLAGCGSCPPLDEVPIRGAATDADRRTIAAELADMRDRLALRVCLPSVRVVEKAGHEGRYNSVTRQVRVLDGVDDLAGNLRHEVCHGVDLQNEVTKNDPAPFDIDIGAFLDGPQGPKETFAALCAYDGDVLATLWPSDCPETPSDALRIVRDDVYGLPTGAGATFETIAVLSLETLGPPYAAATDVSMKQTVDPDRLQLILDGRDCCDRLEVDKWTGAVLPSLDVEREGGGLDPATIDTPAWSTAESAVLDDGTQLVFAVEEFSFAQVWDFSAYRDGEWLTTEGHPCGNHTVDFFASEGEVWSTMLDLDRHQVVWGRWTPAR